MGAVVVVLAPQLKRMPESAPSSVPTPSAQPPEVSDIVVDQPPPGTAIAGNRVMVRGKARGSWFFEGVFPVRVVSEDGTELGRGTAQAASEWMTSDFVPFSAELTIDLTKPSSAAATLVLEKDNPSGLPELSQTFTVPISVCGVKFCH